MQPILIIIRNKVDLFYYAVLRGFFLAVILFLNVASSNLDFLPSNSPTPVQGNNCGCFPGWLVYIAEFSFGVSALEL